jgi:hypothetical protein
MMGYSRVGVYNNNLKAKSLVKEKKSFDYINIVLGVLLFVVIFIFIIT